MGAVGHPGAGTQGVAGAARWSGLPVSSALLCILLAAAAVCVPAGAFRTLDGRIAVATGAAFASADPAGEMPSELNVPFQATLSTTRIPQGGEAFVAVSYEVPPDAHIQLNEFFFASPAEGEPFSLGEPVRPKGEVWEGEPIFRGHTPVFYRLKLSPKLAPGAHTLKLTAGYQACVEKPAFGCFAPAEQTFSLPIEVLPAGTPAGGPRPQIFAEMTQPPPAPKGGEGTQTAPETATGTAPETTPPATEAAITPGTPASAPAATPDGEVAAAPAGTPAAPAETPRAGGLAGRLQEAFAKRSFLAFLLVFLGGIASSFTPCVYPMIPITISYIGGRSTSRLSGFILSVFFVLGIAITYAALGVAAASTGALFGSAMQSTPVILAVSAIFFAMGASMLGAFDLVLPSGLQTKMQGGPKAGVIGAFFMGMVTGLVASPCVGPIVVVLLTQVAQVGSIAYGFLILFTFAVGLGLLFLVIGTFAGALSAMPQAGGWMDTVKHVFGVILIAMGIYYVRALLGPELTWIVSGVFVLLVGTFLGAFRPIPEDPAKSILFRKGFGMVFLLAGSFVMIMGLARYTKVPMIGGGGGGPAAVGAPQHAGLNWVMDDESGFSQAKSQGKPIVMDFYADWCTACRELDEKTWVAPDVRSAGERFVAIKMDMTAKNARNQSKQTQYKVPGLPTVIFYDSNGREVQRFFGFKSASDVLAIMEGVR